jgi:starch phosphorylase
VSARYPHDGARVARMSLIDESGPRYVRMAHLATVGSHAINGVAALHTELLKRDTLRDFYEMYPERFSNKTNGVTPRRWMALSNPRLSKLITEKIGEKWILNLDELRGLEPYADDPEFRHQWRSTQEQIKDDLAVYIREKSGVAVSAQSLFDVQVKRIHEYKRQHLAVLHIVTLYHQLKRNPNAAMTPRTFIFGGKAAPGYFMAKLIIKLIHSVAEVINNDSDVGGRLRVAFVPNFNVTVGQRIYPAADLAEQISTAGKEASGTGCMKFAMNGALTIGTLDGANIEIREQVGAENFFLFGLTTEQVAEWKAGGYQPRGMYNQNQALRDVLDSLVSGHFSRGDRNLFRPLVDSLLDRDEYMLLADYQAYVDCQAHVSAVYNNMDQWSRMSILNVARIGMFSSDRTIKEYCRDIWYAEPVTIRKPGTRESESRTP